MGSVSLPARRAGLPTSTALIFIASPIRGRDFIATETHLQLWPSQWSHFLMFEAPCSGWMRYHIAGLRVFAAGLDASYLDYSRKEGEGFPNHMAVEKSRSHSFLLTLNLEKYKEHPGIQTISESPTIVSMVLAPHASLSGGLGLLLNGDMGLDA